jgi:hypothetical protein
MGKNIKSDLQEMVWEGVDWIAVAQDKYKSLAGVNVEINLLFYKM